MGCLLAIFAFPVMIFKGIVSFFRWMFTNGIKGYIIGGAVIVLILISFFVIRGAVHTAMAPDPAPAVEKAEVLPSRTLAPYLVTTWSRTYYAYRAVKNEDGTVTMTDYYEIIKGEWTLTKGALVLDKNYGTVTVKKRSLGN